MGMILTFGCCPILTWISVHRTSISRELDVKANIARGVTAVWCLNFLEQDLWTSQSRPQACNIWLAATLHLFIVQTLLLQQVYGQEIYGIYFQQDQRRVWKFFFFFFCSNSANIYWILCGAFKLRHTMRVLLGSRTYLCPDFYFLTCNLS